MVKGTWQKSWQMATPEYVRKIKAVEHIKAGEYIDFMVLPLARGKNRPPVQAAEGQIVVVQATDLSRALKLIPDLST